MSIYVEIAIRGSMDELWGKTQQPELHRRWDLRFSDIDYLPRQPGEPQRFRYATRIGGGMRIEGAGESTGTRDANGQRTSALKFWSADPKSLIETGSGYWRYVPNGDGLRFLTWYDYQVRFGAAGRLVDSLIFRPLLGWATAWSFDRLRLWMERGISPEVSRERTLVHGLARIGVAFVWLYQGTAPKLLQPHADEVGMLLAAGVPQAHALTALQALGWLEVGLALALLLLWRHRWPLWLAIAALVTATLTVAATSPGHLAAAFNPVTLNVATAALAGVALLAGRDLPSAANCLRRPRKEPA